VKARSTDPWHSSGSALFLCLILLVAFTLLGVSLASALQLQQRVQNNQERANTALRAANTALAEAERWLFLQPAAPPPAACREGCFGENPLWVQIQVPQNIQQLDTVWWQAHAQFADVLSGQAYWLIAELRAPQGLDSDSAVPAGIYRALGLGTDESANTATVTESIVVRPWAEGPDPSVPPTGSLINQFCQVTGSDPCGRVAWRQLR
jgi:hypothetical protein